MKNALEGMGLSAALEPFMHALRGFKSQALAKAWRQGSVRQGRGRDRSRPR
jgi:hypothetical protein